MRRLPVAVAAAFCAACLLAPAVPLAHRNARFYRGDIVVSTSWEGTIRLTGAVVIREGVTVTIEPGTEILVQPNAGADIVVRGRLLVRGVPGKPVRFGSAGGCPAGRWGGIAFLRGSVGVLEHARIDCSATGITGDLGNVTQRDVSLETGR